jgi:hypothetical protein
MSEDLPPSIWPGGHRSPPFGFIKCLMPGQQGIAKEQQISFMHMKIHTPPEITRFSVMARVNALGETKFYSIDKNWEEAEYNFKEYRKAIKARRQAMFREMLAETIVRTRGQPQPSKDLF